MSNNPAIKSSYLVLVIIIIQVALNAQPKTLDYEHIGSEQGLSTNSGLCIIRDSEGYMWFGSQNGLNRYDGYDFTIFRHDPLDSNSISDDYLNSIYESRFDSRALWVGTNVRGLNRFDRNTETFVSYEHDPTDQTSLSEGSVYAICEDATGALWVGTNPGGLNRFNPETGAFKRFQHDPEDPNSLSGNRISAIYADHSARLWIGTSGGLSRLDREDSGDVKFTNWFTGSADPNMWSESSIIAICESQKDGTTKLWIGTLGGQLYQILRGNAEDEAAPRFIASLEPHINDNERLWSMHADQFGSLWIGTIAGGLYNFDPANKVFTKYDQITASTVRSVYADNSGILWLGTESEGVYKIVQTSKEFVHYQHDPADPSSLSHNDVTSIYEDKSGMIWAGTRHGGLNKFNKANGQFKHYMHDPTDSNGLSHNHVRGIFEDSFGEFWVSSWNINGGLHKFDRETEFFRRYPHDPANPKSLRDNQVRCVFEDSFLNLWVGSSEGGLSRLRPEDRDKMEFTHFLPDPADPNSLSDEAIMCITETTHDGITLLWIGTFDGGLNKFDPTKNKFTQYQNDPNDPYSISHNRIWTVYQDKAGRLWVGSNKGLNRFDWVSARFTHYTERDGLCNNVIYGILEDDHGNLWLSTQNGLSKFDPETEIFTNYDVHDGLQDNEFNHGANSKSKTGKMYFGGINGFNHFHPDSIKSNPHVPPVKITSLKVFEKEVELDAAISQIREIKLPYTDRFFSFEFAALDYHKPKKNQYAFKLDGLHHDWIYCGNRRYVSFSHLDPGNYAFRVKGSNNDGVWNEQGASLRITILPPWYRTWWAYLIYGVLILGFAYAARWAVANRKSLLSLRARKISHYKLLELLGKGGMGEVYKALDVNTKQIVAIKLLNAEVHDDPQNRLRFAKEGKLLASFSHPHIVKVYEIGETGKQGFIAMEYLPGGTLKEYLEEKEYLSLRGVKELLLRVADGLKEIHNQGIVHRDVKTGNCMLDENGNVRIMDFGLSRSPLVTTMTTLGTVIGTLGYVAPEQVTGTNVDHRVDIFSFGVVMYELLTNQLPFKGENEMALIHSIFNTVPPAPSTLREGDMPKGWDQMVLRCLEKNPIDRFASMEDLIESIDQLPV